MFYGFYETNLAAPHPIPRGWTNAGSGFYQTKNPVPTNFPVRIVAGFNSHDIALTKLCSVGRELVGNDTSFGCNEHTYQFVVSNLATTMTFDRVDYSLTPRGKKNREHAFINYVRMGDGAYFAELMDKLTGVKK